MQISTEITEVLKLSEEQKQEAKSLKNSFDF
jgi:hypothetical protein